MIGLGSMGQRRIRNLRHLGFNTIAGFDTNPDRLSFARNNLDLTCFESIDLALEIFNPDTFIVSTSPESHLHYARLAAKHSLSAFIEASVVDASGLFDLAQSISGSSSIILPSCTMLYYPFIKRIKSTILDGFLGRPLYFTYSTGQYLPDWHPWEGITDYYVSNKPTGGCRELVPFELTWIIDLFGMPSVTSSFFSKLSDLDADIDDFYSFNLAFPHSVFGSVSIDVLSRPVPSRSLRVVCSNGLLVFDGDSNTLKWRSSGSSHWSEEKFVYDDCHPGYINPETPYISELSDFVSAVTHNDPSLFPNTITKDVSVLNLLHEIESCSL